MLLTAEGITKSFGGFMAVDGVSLEIEEGELSSIIGPNGAGKTTLFNLLTGKLRGDQGTIMFNGENIAGLAPFEICRRGIGRSFQRTNIFPELSAFDNVQIAVLSTLGKTRNLVSPVKNMAREETGRILESVQLEDKRDVLGGLLSHGDQKRLDFGIALALQPRLLLLDEPTAGMSPTETGKTTELIEKLARDQGLTLIFVEHDMNVVFGISRKVRVMHLGRIIATGSPEEVKANEEVQRIYLGGEAA
jgi:branched-chain amino acid transport system ATP-binding protein